MSIDPEASPDDDVSRSQDGEIISGEYTATSNARREIACDIAYGVLDIRRIHLSA